jgi:SAM-dependent methyltransferase
VSELYGEQFYQAIREGAARSAAVIVPMVIDLVHPESVVDVGCGTGAWLARFQQYGVRQIQGLENSTIGAHLADIDPSRIRRIDATRPFHLERTFDLVMSLEVAEHLPEECAAGFVSSLTGLGAVVLFSAAVPGQTGTGHINEQWPSYWVRHFADHEFTVVDCLRDRIWNDSRIEWWYRQNLLLFVAKHHLPRYISATPGANGEPPALDRMMPYRLRYPAAAASALPPLSTTPAFGVVMLTRNGAGRIGRCLESIAALGFAGEIVVCVDRESTDDTVAVARRYTPHVHLIETGGMLETALPAMAAHCTAEYVLRLDDDETLGGNWDPFSLEALLRSNGFTHLILPRLWLIPPGDRFISTPPWFPDYQIRFFRNDPDLIRWSPVLHEPMEMKGRGLFLFDRWIEHHDLVIHSRPERERKAQRYRRIRPEKHLSHLYLYEEQQLDLLPATPEGYAQAVSAYLARREGHTASPVFYEAGTEIRFEAGGNSTDYTRAGWGEPESWGRWTNGFRAEMVLPLAQPLEGSALLAVESMAFVRDWHPLLHVRVECNREMVGEWAIDAGAFTRRTMTLPSSALAAKRELRLVFHVDNPASPGDFGEFGPDPRLLGLGFHVLRVDRLERESRDT